LLRPVETATAMRRQRRECSIIEGNDALTIDVVSDVVCPWCYLGERRLEAALAQESRPVDVRWRPYQLDPTIPEEGLDMADYLERKFGRDGRLKSVHDQLARLGAEVGISFAFDKILRAPNTLDAHRLIRWARSSGAQREVVDRLFRAYFTEGRDVRDRAVLVDVTGARDLDAEIVEKLLSGGADAVRREIAEAQAIGVTGVPFFIFAGRIGLPGAQDVPLLHRAMLQARQNE
jgi:predicted DsbA family dithiol-disulfide isomerase